jgi:hypothetical protein
MAKQKPSTDTGQAEIKWPNFRPVEYSLNSDVIFKIPINELRPSSDGGDLSTTPTTVGDAFKLFNGWLRKEGEEYVEIKGEPISEITYLIRGGLVLKTASGEKRFAGTRFAVQLLYLLLSLRKDGTNPYAARWFFYDKDYTIRDVGESFTFFVVCDGKIVHEKISFSWYPYPAEERFDLTTIFNNQLEKSGPIWRNDQDWDAAEKLFWYRKFYTETKTGQLTLLRPDQPEIHCYPKDQWQWMLLGFIDRRLQRTNILLTALFFLVFIAMVIWLLR